MIVIERAEVSTLAVRATDCTACGARIRKERTFTEPVLTGVASGALSPRALAVARLIASVAAWKDEPAVCVRCPGKRS